MSFNLIDSIRFWYWKRYILYSRCPRCKKRSNISSAHGGLCGKCWTDAHDFFDFYLKKEGSNTYYFATKGKFSKEGTPKSFESWQDAKVYFGIKDYQDLLEEINNK